jgi:hypothetical protein
MTSLTVSGRVAQVLSSYVSDVFGVMGNGNVYFLDAAEKQPPLHRPGMRVQPSRWRRQPFLNVASVGLSVAVAEALSARSKRYIGPPAHSVATPGGYARHRPFRARLEFPEGDHEPLELGALLQVTVGITAATRSPPPQGSTTTSLISTPSERGHLREHVSIARLLKDSSST